MKILYLHDAIARLGGLERIQVGKMNYLADVLKEDVYLITTCQGNHPFSFPLSKNVHHIDINVRFHLQYQYNRFKRIFVSYKMKKDFKIKFSQIIKKINPDFIITSTYYKADEVCKLKPCRAKKIIESHCAKSHTGINDGIKRNILYECIHKYQRNKYIRTIEQKSDLIVTLTKGDMLEWNSSNIMIIPNMVDIPIIMKPSSCTSNHVISAGRFVYEKGFDRLIKAWALVHQVAPEWILDLYGSGELEDQLRQMILDNNLETYIYIHKETDNIYEKFAESSIYVLPSRYEGFGMVLVEAMACGLPCVSFDIPYGPAEIIKNEENGLIVENGNIQALSSAILKLIMDQNLRKRIGAKAYDSVKNFSSNIVMKKWQLLFEKLLS